MFDIGATVPLVIWSPEAAGMGRNTDAVVELIDLYSSLADLAGLEPLLEDPSTSCDRPAFTQVVRPDVGMGFSVHLGQWRLTQWGHLDLYDVTKDKEG